MKINWSSVVENLIAMAIAGAALWALRRTFEPSVDLSRPSQPWTGTF